MSLGDSSNGGNRTPVLAMRGISKRFAGVQALQDVSISVDRAEVVALLGENGAGKSTLMKVLGGLHQPDTGEILWEGKPVTIRSVTDSIKLGISFIHQELNVLDNLDIAGNVFLGREPVKGGPLKLLDRDKMIAETQPYLDQLGLNFPASLPLDRLSLAQRQMVEIAKALSLKARILIMDEPTSSLTLSETARLLSVVKELREQGVGIFYISHRLEEVRQIADRAVGLRDGKNAGELARDEITHERMVKLMVGRDLAPHSIPESDGKEKSDILVLDKIRTTRYPNREVSLSLKQGEILGLSGLVGAGRSELATAVFGVEPPLSGTISLNGTPIQIRTPKDAINHRIYLIPEDRRRTGLIVEMSVGTNISLPALEQYATAGLVRGAQEKSATTDAAKQLRVKAPNVDFLAKNLSGGNQQKVVIAKWLSLNPKVVIFDEPTRGIDVGAKAEIYTLIRELADKGVGVLVISSDMEEVLRLSDRIAVMHEGRLTGVLDRKDASEEAILHLAVGGDR